MANKTWLRPQARSDIVELALYIGRESTEAANRFLDSTDATFALLAETPMLGAAYATENQRLRGIRVHRAIRFPNHLVFYIARNNGIEVVRVLHGARDLDTALDD